MIEVKNDMLIYRTAKEPLQKDRTAGQLVQRRKGRLPHPLWQGWRDPLRIQRGAYLKSRRMSDLPVFFANYTA